MNRGRKRENHVQEWEEEKEKTTLTSLFSVSFFSFSLLHPILKGIKNLLILFHSPSCFLSPVIHVIIIIFCRCIYFLFSFLYCIWTEYAQPTMKLLLTFCNCILFVRQQILLWSSPSSRFVPFFSSESCDFYQNWDSYCISWLIASSLMSALFLKITQDSSTRLGFYGSWSPVVLCV